METKHENSDIKLNSSSCTHLTQVFKRHQRYQMIMRKSLYALKLTCYSRKKWVT